MSIRKVDQVNSLVKLISKDNMLGALLVKGQTYRGVAVIGEEASIEIGGILVPLANVEFIEYQPKDEGNLYD